MKLKPPIRASALAALTWLLICAADAPAIAQQTANARQLQQAQPIASWPVKAKRWALVIGVDQYADPQISPLKGAANDAHNLGDALTRYAGFPLDQVILLATDQPTERQPTRLNILRRLSNLASLVPKDGLLLISFSGHGIERGGQAYLVPSDSQLTDDVSLLEESAVSVARIKDRIHATGVGQVVILLDACRNDPGGRADAPNPLTATYTRAFNFDVRNREVSAFVTLYATAVGQRAYEYTEKKQGYFTWAVVEGLRGGAANENGEVTLANLVKYVQENVPKRVAIDLGAGKQQRPFSQTEGYKADELVIAVGTGSPASSNLPATPAISTVDPAAFELSYWDSIKNSNNVDDFKSYLDKYPDGQFAALAKNKIGSAGTPARAESKTDSDATELAFWDSIKNSANADDYRAYLRRYPNGAFVDLAKNRVNGIAPPEAGKVGMQFQSKNNQVLILSVLPIGPAARAGLKGGDQILKVNGQEVTSLSTETISALLRGNEGTELTLTVMSSESSSAREVSLTREKASLLEKAEAEELAKQTKSFKCNWGIRMALASGFYQGTLIIYPDKIHFIFDGDKVFAAGRIMPVECSTLTAAILDKSAIREVAMSNNKFRFNFSSSADAAAAFEAMREVCKTR